MGSGRPSPLFLERMKISKTQLGEAVREIRKHRGLTQKEVAARTGMTINYLSLLENGKRGIRMRRLNDLAELFEMPVSSLLALAQSPDDHPASADLVRSMHGLIRAALKATTPTET